MYSKLVETFLKMLAIGIKNVRIYKTNQWEFVYK